MEISTLNDMKLNILYYCKSGKNLMDISSTFNKDYWYISHIMSQLRFNRLVSSIRKGKIVIFSTPIDILIDVEQEMRRRRQSCSYPLICVSEGIRDERRE